MTPQKVLEVIAKYRRMFEEGGYNPFELPLDRHAAPSERAALNHCYSMLDPMEQFVAEGKMEKVFRWLGFIQGVLFKCGMYTINDMREHNVDSEAEKNARAHEVMLQHQRRERNRLLDPRCKCEAGQLFSMGTVHGSYRVFYSDVCPLPHERIGGFEMFTCLAEVNEKYPYHAEPPEMKYPDGLPEDIAQS